MIVSLSDRSQYECLSEVAYLNQASLGLICQDAVAAMHTFLDDVARHGNLKMSDEDEVAFLAALRDRGGALMNCPPAQLAIVSSAGEILSQLPYLIKPEPGTKIVSVSSDFPAITRPWIAYAEANDIALHFVDDVPDDDLTDTLIHSIDDRTSVVAVSYVQFGTGTRVDVDRLRKATTQVGAKLVLDVTQAAGTTPIDATGWAADALVCSGYKWLGGHGGVGLAVLSWELLERTPPAPGWMGAPDPFDMQPTKLLLANDARRFTQSTMSYVSVHGLARAVGQVLALDPQAVCNHAKQLRQLLVEELTDTGWTPFRTLDDAAASAHIVSLSHPEAHIETVLGSLERNKIVCGSRNGRVRVSLAHYNNGHDVLQLISALNRT